MSSSLKLLCIGVCFILIPVLGQSVEIECIPIKSCPSVMHTLRTQGDDPEVRKFLHSLQCGYDSSNGVRVWCHNLQTCTTPDGRNGTCSSIFKCKSVIQLLKDPKYSTSFIKQFECNAADRDNAQDIHVCCPDVTNTNSVGITLNQKVNVMGSIPKPELKECGIQELDSSRIYGGRNTELAEYPWTALLRYERMSGGFTFGCGGTLINSRYILTAAHCVDEEILRSVDLRRLTQVVLGEYDTNNKTDCIHFRTGSNCADPPVSFDVEKIIKHQSFNMVTNKNDIALLKLNRPVGYSVYIRPICLPPSNEKLTGNEIFSVAGWGRTNITGIRMSTVKQKAELKFSNPNLCNANVPERYYLNENQVCAGTGNGIDTCKGDSGGPLMLNKITDTADIQVFLYGVTSYGIARCGDGPSIFTYVPSYISWILENV